MASRASAITKIYMIEFDSYGKRKSAEWLINKYEEVWKKSYIVDLQCLHLKSKHLEVIVQITHQEEKDKANGTIKKKQNKNK